MVSLCNSAITTIIAKRVLGQKNNRSGNCCQTASQGRYVLVFLVK